MSVDNLEKRNDIFINDFIKNAVSWLDNGASILGGCCEISSEFIAGINRYLKKNNYNKV